MYDQTPSQDTGSRALVSVLLLLLVPLCAAVVLAPHVLAGLHWINQYVDLGHHFRDPPLRRVASRVATLVALLMLVPCFRMAGMTSRGELGVPKMPGRWKQMGWAALAGMVSMALIYLLFQAVGAVVFDPQHDGLVEYLEDWGAAVAGAVFIGIFEEVFFRGYIFGVLARRSSFWFSTLLSSALFSFIHLIRPRLPDLVDPTHWSAGFQLLPHLTDGFNYVYFWPTVTALLLMGVLFCQLYRLCGNLYVAIGLHAGWVAGLAMAISLYMRNGTRLWALFGPSKTVFMTWAGVLILVVAIAAVQVVTVRRSRLRRISDHRRSSG